MDGWMDGRQKGWELSSMIAYTLEALKYTCQILDVFKPTLSSITSSKLMHSADANVVYQILAGAVY